MTSWKNVFIGMIPLAVLITAYVIVSQKFDFWVTMGIMGVIIWVICFIIAYWKILLRVLILGLLAYGVFQIFGALGTAVLIGAGVIAFTLVFVKARG
jgi:hypothetical protein